MAIIEWQQKKETFNPEKNYFDITYEKVSRETSDEEDLDDSEEFDSDDEEFFDEDEEYSFDSEDFDGEDEE